MSALTEQIVRICLENEANSDFLLHEGENLRFRDAIGNVCSIQDTIINGAELARMFCANELEEKKAANADAYVDLLDKLALNKGDEDKTVTAGEFRFRANIFMHGGEQKLGAVLRRIHHKIPTFADLGLDESLIGWLNNRSGLILVTGPAGSGKTSTLAACVDYLNKNRAGHIISIEDPIEYIHTAQKSLITQREIGHDTESFPVALRAALRQNPNVLVVGEIRDRETIETALHAAETGHLVLATMHATSAARAPERVIDNIPESLKPLTRSQLSSTLIGVLAQMLVPRHDQTGKVLATEAMANYAEVSAHIKAGSFGQLDNAMAHGGEDPNLWLLNMRLIEMISRGVIQYEAALDATYNRHDLEERYSQLVSNGGGH